jgi:peptidyl-prolyl cis-trans isomerase SurA
MTNPTRIAAEFGGRSTRTTITPFLLPIALLAIAGCNHTHSADVVATVNGHAIMRADMDRVYQAKLGEAQGQKPSPEEADSLRLEIVHQLITDENVDQRAAKMNLTATPEDVDAKVADIKARYTEEQFNQWLQTNHTTLDELKHDIRRSLTMTKLLNKEIESKITVSDADVASYYNQHKADFNLIETRYRLAEIIVTAIPSPAPGNLQGSKATTDAEAKKKIQALKNRLNAGDDFGALAMNYSEDPETTPNGGDMGYLFESQMRSDPTVYAAITKLNAGQTTEILPVLDGKKPVGYAIYKLISKEQPGQRDLSDPRVQQGIRQQLHNGRAELLRAAYLEMLQDQAKIENFLADEILSKDAK